MEMKLRMMMMMMKMMMMRAMVAIRKKTPSFVNNKKLKSKVSSFMSEYSSITSKYLIFLSSVSRTIRKNGYIFLGKHIMILLKINRITEKLRIEPGCFDHIMILMQNSNYV